MAGDGGVRGCLLREAFPDFSFLVFKVTSYSHILHNFSSKHLLPDTILYLFTAVIVQLHLGRGFKKPVLQTPPKPIKSEYEGGGQASLFYKKTPPRDSNVQPGAHSPEGASQTSMCIQ